MKKKYEYYIAKSSASPDTLMRDTSAWEVAKEVAYFLIHGSYDSLCVGRREKK